MDKLLGSNANKVKTFRPPKKVGKGTKLEQLHDMAKATLGISQNLKAAVKLPGGEDLNEWLAAHVIDFYNQLNLLYGAVDEFCDDDKYPEMNAGPGFVYLWADGEKIKKPIACSARSYVDYLFSWLQVKFDDDAIFPTTPEKPFPKDFKKLIETMFKRMFRVLAFLYVHHFTRIQEMGNEAHLNAVFKHFLFFTQEFNLVPGPEMAPLADLVEKFTGKRPS